MNVRFLRIIGIIRIDLRINSGNLEEVSVVLSDFR